MTGFNPIFSITNRMTSAITQIERARGFLEAARLSDDWVRDMGNQALIKGKRCINRTFLSLAECCIVGFQQMFIHVLWHQGFKFIFCHGFR